MTGKIKRQLRRRHLCLDCSHRDDTDWEAMMTLCTLTGTRNERGRIVTGCNFFKRRLEPRGGRL